MRFISGTTIRPWRSETRRSRPHKVLALALILALLPLPAFATTGIPTSMRVALISPRDVELYPLRVMDRNILSMLDLVYESLIVLDDERRPTPGLATSWETMSDGKTWTFHLRENVYFHNGLPVTAHDVAATMDAIKTLAADESLADNEKGMYSNVANVCSSWRAEDNYTLVVRTDRACYGLLYAMTFPILQAQTIWDENPPGSGPYRVEYYQAGEEMWLAANPAWYGAAPYISEIEGIWYDSERQALTDYESEDVDIVMTRSTAAVRYRGTTSSRSNAYDYATRQLECLLYNYSGQLKNQQMREAISYAIDKSRLISNTYQGMATDTDTLQSRSSWLYNEDVITYGYDVARANSILDSLSWDNFNDEGYRIQKGEAGQTTVLEFRLNYYDEAGNSLRKEVATEIAAMLKAVGIKTKMSSYTFENAVSKLKARDYDLFLCAYNLDVVPDPNFILLSNGYGNYVGYRSDDLNTFCQELRRSFEAQSFQNAWFDVQEQMAKELPFLPLYWRSGIVLTRYPYSSVRDIREYELLKSINEYK